MTRDQEIMQLAAEVGVELVPGEVNDFAKELMRVTNRIKKLSEEEYQALLENKPEKSEVIECMREINLEDTE